MPALACLCHISFSVNRFISSTIPFLLPVHVPLKTHLNSIPSPSILHCSINIWHLSIYCSQLSPRSYVGFCRWTMWFFHPPPSYSSPSSTASQAPSAQSAGTVQPYVSFPPSNTPTPVRTASGGAPALTFVSTAWHLQDPATRSTWPRRPCSYACVDDNNILDKCDLIYDGS